MMNKSKNSKAWRWKVATFLPLLALLLMAFGNRSENLTPEQNLFPLEAITNPQDSVKQWTEADFGKLQANGIEKLFFEGEMYLLILMNNQSQLLVNNNKCMLADIATKVRNYRDFNLTNNRSLFGKITINGIEKIVPNVPIIIRRDVDTAMEDYHKLLSVVGNTIMEIRGKYANELFKQSYQKLSVNQKNEIDKLVPLEVFIGLPKKSNGIAPPPPPTNFFIYIKKDGNYVDNKLISMDKLSDMLLTWKNKFPHGVVNVKIKKDIVEARVAEVKNVLRNAKVLHVNYSTLK